MGNATWSKVDWNAHATRTASKTRAEIFTEREINPELDPSKFEYRESRDSPANPQSTPIILASDVTGSMGMLAEQIIKRDLGKIMEMLYDEKPVTDPHILCAAIGDAYCDSAPLQCTQFEASIVLAEQLKKFYVEGGGGGNMGESYPLAWFFAAYKTKVDSIWKRHHKGYLFTIGDECALPTLDKKHLKRVLNVDTEVDMDAATLLRDAEKDWNIFHLIVKPVGNQPVVSSWRDLLGERAIEVKDLAKLGEGIVGVIRTVEAAANTGASVDSTALVRAANAGVVHV